MTVINLLITKTPQCLNKDYEPKYEILKNPEYIKYLINISFNNYDTKINFSNEGKIFRVLWGDGFAAMKVSSLNNPIIDIIKEIDILENYSNEPGIP